MSCGWSDIGYLLRFSRTSNSVEDYTAPPQFFDEASGEWLLFGVRHQYQVWRYPARAEEAAMDFRGDYQARHEHYLELLAEAEQERRIRAVLANRPRKARFFAPALAALGRRLIIWGRRLRARYGEVVIYESAYTPHIGRSARTP